jgi:hypothetical protein
MRLVIVHSHFRPGGVRRVIEMATPFLVAALGPGVDDVVLVAGEAPDAGWLREFRRALGPRRVRCAIEPALGYLSEQRAPPAWIARRIRQHLEEVLGPMSPDAGLIWAHNLGLGRNLLLTRALTCWCRERSVRLVAHHHD